MSAILEELEAQGPVKTQLIRVDNDEQLANALALMTAPVIAVDTETTGLDPLVDRLLLLQFSDGVTNIVIDMTRVSNWESITAYLEKREHLFVLQNSKFDFSWLIAKLDSNVIMPRMFDTMLAEQLLVSGLNQKVGLKEIAKRYLRIDMSKEERATFVGMTGNIDFTDAQLEYAAKDVEILPTIFAKQAKKLAKMKMIEIAQVEFNLAKTVSRMELRGVLIDVVEWQKVVDGATVRCAELEAEMKELAGDPKFNPRSSKQVLEALKKNGYVLGSSNAGTLKKVDHPLATAMLEYRKAVVLRDRYGEGWLARLGSDNRIRASFRQIGAATGRFSSANPNLQQLPRGDLLRKAFIAGEGRSMITADYSQIEIRILAEYSGDDNMIQAFAEDVDIHSATAKMMFNLPELPDKDSLHRQMAKSVNFGLIYGAGAQNLQGQLSEQGVNVTKAEAEHLIKLYFAAFPKAQKWLDAQSRRAYNAIDEGIDVMTTTLGGRVRLFEVVPNLSPYERGHIARQARNSPIQGSSADVTKQAMNLLDAEFLAHPEWDAYLLMCVHDELVAECKSEYAQVVGETVERCMIDGGKKYMSKCKVKVDWKIAECWQK